MGSTQHSLQQIRRVSIQVVPRPVVPPRRPRVSMSCGVLHIPDDSRPGIEAQGDEGVPQVVLALVGTVYSLCSIHDRELRQPSVTPTTTPTLDSLDSTSVRREANVPSICCLPTRSPTQADGPP